MRISNNFLQLTGWSGALLMASLLSGCAAYFHQPTGPQRARLGEETALTGELRRLPAAREPIVAAVYKFRDQTGQYKQSETGSTFSTAISQGTTNILLKALEESGWFVPIERENVSNLLNERKIVRSSVAQYKDGENLPPLLFAGVILEGGIVSYDANIVTGGAGLRYFASGGSTQYRQDRVTVYLRAVATRTGKILKTIYTSKTILSQSVDASVFRYVRFKRLLEAETGYTTNEPSQMAITEAIEKAVQSLIIEGIRDGLWAVNEKAQAETKVLLEQYEKEKTEMSQTDVYGVKLSENGQRAPLVSLMPFAGMWRYKGDLNGPVRKLSYGVAAEFAVTSSLALGISAEMGTLATTGGIKAPLQALQGMLLWRPLPLKKVSPVLWAGGGVIQREATGEQLLKQKKYALVSGGIGLQYSPVRWLALRGGMGLSQPLTDALDGRIRGSYNDYLITQSVGLLLRFGQAKRINKGTTSPVGVKP